MFSSRTCRQKTAFLRVNGEWVHFDNFAPRLSKTTHRALQQLFESLFWTIFFLKSWCKSYSKMYYFAQVGHKNHCCGKADFLKFYRFSYHFLKIDSVFLHHFLTPNYHHLVKARFVPSPNALFCTTLGTILDFTPFWHFFLLFLSFSPFLSFYVVGKNVSLACVKRTTLKNLCRR